MAFRYRLTFSRTSPGFFQVEDEALSFTIDAETELRVVARDADRLSLAARFHIESGGFADLESAMREGERLRIRLQILNAALGLRFNVPTGNTPAGQFSDEVEAAVLDKSGVVLVNSVNGLSVVPDDGKHAELIQSGRVDVYPNEPSYLFRELAKVWHHEIQMTARSQDALEILGRANAEIAPRNQFLLTYLACERMVDRGRRSERARNWIDKVIQRISEPGLDSREADSLRGAIASLKDKSFPSALRELIGRIQDPPQICEMPLEAFISTCIRARNSVAHDTVTSSIDFGQLVLGLRQFVISLIWSENRLAHVSLKQPISTVRIPQGGFVFRIR